MSECWSGRWFKIGKTIHAERHGLGRTAMCGRAIAKDGKSVPLDAKADICDGCWKAASR